MKRREPPRAGPAVPERLVRFVPSEWLPLVDPARYDTPRLPPDDWRRREAVRLWQQAGLAWIEAHGQLNGMTLLDWLAFTRSERRAHARAAARRD